MKRFALAIAFVFAAVAAFAQSLPLPKGEERYAVIEGHISNFDSTAGNASAIVYPRYALGRYADMKQCSADIDSTGRFSLNVKLYQTHQPCFIEVPGLYGLIYLSPSDSVALNIDMAHRWARGHQGDPGSAVYVGGADCDINNALCNNDVHYLLWQSFGNTVGRKADFSKLEDLVEAAMKHRAEHLAAIDSLDCPERAKEVLRLDGNADVAYNLFFMALTIPGVQPDASYYSFAKDLNISDPMLRWASCYDQLLNFCLGMPHDDCDADAVTHFSEVTGIDDPQFLQTLRLADIVQDIKREQPVADSTLAEIAKWADAAEMSFIISENDALKARTGLTNISQISPDDEGLAAFLDILGKHKGKLILIDFWNTWCGPCKSSIAEIEPQKPQYADSPVAFVYIADETSPIDTWNAMTPDIAGDHYRLPVAQTKSMMQLFGTDAFPTYVLIDKDGEILGMTHHFDSLSEVFDPLME
ncbi:MAG: TlpA family protein disulfide reductase [Muribaculaceae bacterium]|nr:TlpA family protein disulfide reductase [Muribaculaceae bacterium]